MIIKSRFRDYYDHVSHLYGGGDPNVIYLRDRLVDMKHGLHKKLEVDFPEKKNLRKSPYIDMKSAFYGYNFKWLVVTGCYYLILEPMNAIESGYKIFNEKNFPSVWNSYKNRVIPFYMRESFDFTDHTPDQTLINLSKKIGQPVFTIPSFFIPSSPDIIGIDAEIPNLGELGMASVVSPQTMYQDIAYFIGNTIKDSPDMMPPTKMTDLEKVEQHGFDKRVSFRHRK